MSSTPAMRSYSDSEEDDDYVPHTGERECFNTLIVNDDFECTQNRVRTVKASVKQRELKHP